MDILDIFYNYVIKEACTGRVYCYFYFNTLFNTYIVEDNKHIESNIEYENVHIPTLMIKDKGLFNELLIEYVNKALTFYNEDNYPEEVINKIGYNQDRVSKEKMIMTLLFSNATYEDFIDPIDFLKKRIAFMDNNKEDTNNHGYSSILDGDIETSIIKDKIYNETPFKFVIKLSNNGEEFIFPEIRFGIYDDTLYIYAMQNAKNINNNNYSKKVNRALFKIGEGFDNKVDNYEIFNEGNLKDISASFLVALNIFINYMNSLGYNKICVSSILMPRWNGKVISILEKDKLSLTESKKDEMQSNVENIQKNLTEKLLRTFLRLIHHYSGLDVTSFPFDVDSNLHMLVTSKLESNNDLLNETANLVNKNKRSL
jgi:hypothetical protein